MKKKKKKKQRGTSQNRGYDVHHLLFQRRYWNRGYAKALREMHYFKMLVPTLSLHHYIHLAVNHIPVPPENECRKAFELTNKALSDGFITEEDTLEERLDWLIWLFEKCPETQVRLEVIKDLVHQFYEPP